MKSTNLCIIRMVIGGLLTFPFLLGCSGGKEFGPTVQVSGKVTLDSEPFSKASIWFNSPKSGAGFHTELGPDGSYSLSIKDAQLGESYAVFFGGVEPEKGAVDGAGAPLGPTPPPIPSRYWEGSTSGLNAKINDKKEHTFNFDLNSK